MTSPARRITKALASLAAAASLLIVACSDSTAPLRNLILTGGAPSFEIVDGASGGAVGFNFISPIVPALPSYPGTFDPAQSPVVEVCKWVSGACSGPLVASFSGAAITVSAPSQYYRVDWNTVPVPVGVLHRIRVLENGVELGHADAKKPGTGETAASLTAQRIVPLGNASTLAIRFRLAVNNAPTVTITSPANDAIIPVATPVTLTGTAADLQQGDLTGQIVWRSNRVVAPLGTGGTVTTTLAGGRHTITATVTDAFGVSTTATRQIVVSIVSSPATLNIPYGGTASLPITLSEAAPAGGIAFAISSNNPHVGVNTPTVTVAAGAQAANATLAGTSPGSATVTISNADFGTTTAQVATTANLNIVEGTATFISTTTKQITIELRSAGSLIAAPAGGLLVALTPANPACVAATTVTIPAGLVSTTTTLSYGGTAPTPCNTLVTASATGIAEITTDPIDVTVTTPPPPPALTFNPGYTGTNLGAGLRLGALYVFLGAAAPPGGVVVTLTTSDPTRGVVSALVGPPVVGGTTATYTVPEGSTLATFTVDGIEGATGAVSVTATAPGYSSGTFGLTLTPIALNYLAAPPSTTTTLTPNTALVAEIGCMNAGQFYIAQSIRPGGVARTVNFTGTNSVAGELVTTALTGQNVTATIGIGQSATPATVAAGGVAFHPLGAGVTTVAIAGTGLTAVPVSSQPVTVSAPTFTVQLSGGDRVGAGLRQYNYTRLITTAPAPAGGLAITITSEDPSRIRVAPLNGSVASTSTTIVIAAGGTFVDFAFDGVEGATGSTSITVSAPAFTSVSIPVAVTPVAVNYYSAPPATISTMATNAVVLAQIGSINAAGTGHYLPGTVRPGGTPIVVTFSNTNPAAAQLVTTSLTGQTVTATIGVGSWLTAMTVAAGGVEFDPIGSGTTAVSITSPGALPVSVSTTSVTVSAPGFSFSPYGGDRVGAGLRQGNILRVFPGAAIPPGGLDVTVTSSDPSKGLVASAEGAEVAGTASATIHIAPNNNGANFIIDGVEGASGLVNFTASAPGGFAPTAYDVTVTPVALHFLSPPQNTTTLSPDAIVRAEIGALAAGGTQFYTPQPIRPGGVARTITMTNGASSVAQLVTSAGSAQTATATIAVGASVTPATVALGGIALDPLGGGNTTVGVTGMDFTLVSQSSAVVTVTPPSFSFWLLGGDRVGAGLRQNSVTRVYLGAPAPAGGLLLTFASSAPGVAVVSDAAVVAAGAASATVAVAPGGTFADFVIDGIDGTSGTVTLTASAPGFLDATVPFTVRPTVVQFYPAPSNLSATAANTVITAIVGTLDAGGTALETPQTVRPGSAGITVTFTNSASAVAQLVTSGGTGQSVTAFIGVGAGSTATTVALGGVAMDPLSSGTTTVAVSAPGLTTVAASSKVVTITP